MLNKQIFFKIFQLFKKRNAHVQSFHIMINNKNFSIKWISLIIVKQHVFGQKVSVEQVF
jgi:hypothetical protein